MKKYAIYARKSTESEDRQVLSIGSQVDEMEQVAERIDDLKVVKTYREAKSASKLGRPKFAEMMQDIMDGKIDGILCWKPDRLARNPIDGGQVIWAMKENGLLIRTPGQLYSAETDNMIMLHIEFGMAQKYTDDLSKNVKRGNLTKFKLGGWCGLSPIGYLNKLDDHTIVPDPERFHLVRKFWEMVLEGMPAEEARQVLNEEHGFLTVKRKRTGGRPLSRSTVYKMLRNPFYYGMIERKNNGELMRIQGAHQPMISEEEYWRVQKMMGRPIPRPQKKNFSYTGLIRCGECGAMFTAYEKVKKSGLRYVYYRCTRKNMKTNCKQKQIKEERIEEQVYQILNDMTIPEQWANWAIKWLRYLNETESKDQGKTRESLQNAYNSAQNQIDRLTDMLLRDLITEEEYKQKKTELLNQRNIYKAKLDDKEQESDNWITKVEQVFEFAKTAKQRFEEGDVDVRKKIARDLGSNYTLKDGTVALKLDDVWKVCMQNAEQLSKDVKEVELTRNGVVKEKTTATESVILSWQG